jgi:ADP-heptose:LPS heptosyltransferase
MRDCLLFVGIDSGFSHFANAFSVNKLVLMGNYDRYDTYLPFSGMGDAEVKADLIQFNGTASKIPLKLVTEQVQIKLKDFGKK